MLQLIRYFLFPFTFIYYLITISRNFLYDKNFFNSKNYSVATIVVGNLSMGGTGKTPMVEYLIQILSSKYKTAVLSRGYQRKSKGFLLANIKSTVIDLGDEPYQYHKKFNKISVAVDANRQNGIEQLIKKANPDVILLDDAFQHRKVLGGFYILLTKFDQIYTKDFLFPTGNLRESKTGAKRANLIVVTKCPENISERAQNEIIKKIKPQNNQTVFFSCIKYDKFIYSINDKKSIDSIKNFPKLLIAGIAYPKPFFEYLQSDNDVILEFSDHHDFSDKDIAKILKLSQNKIIITTEKDFMRLEPKITIKNIYYLPIKTKIIKNEENFNQIIKNYIAKTII